MVVVEANVLGYGFGCFPQGQRTVKHVRGGLTGRREFGSGATMKKGRSERGRENVLRVPEQSVLN